MTYPTTSKNTYRNAIIALIIANVIWGAAAPIFKLALQNIPPFTLAFIRFFYSTLLLFPLTASALWIDRKDFLKLILLSLSGITVNIMFFFWGLQLAPSINSPIIASAGPIFLYIFSITILGEKAKLRVLNGTLLSLLGVLTIVGQPLLAHKLDGQFLGNIFFVIATLGSVGHAVFSKEILREYNALTITFWSFLIGSITFLPFFIYELIALHPFATLDLRGVTGIVFGVLLSSTAAYTLFEWGLKKIPAQDVGVFTYIDPLAAAIIAIPLLGEKITPIFLLGSILVFAGIFVAEGRLPWHPIHRLKLY